MKKLWLMGLLGAFVSLDSFSAVMPGGLVDGERSGDMARSLRSVFPVGAVGDTAPVVAGGSGEGDVTTSAEDRAIISGTLKSDGRLPSAQEELTSADIGRARCIRGLLATSTPEYVRDFLGSLEKLTLLEYEELLKTEAPASEAGTV